MRRIKSALVLVSLFAAREAYADNQFKSEMSLLEKKMRLCNTELDNGIKGGGFCNDFSSYNDFLFKGSSVTYMKYHLDNGDVNDSNIKHYLKVLKDLTITMKRITQ